MRVGGLEQVDVPHIGQAKDEPDHGEKPRRATQCPHPRRGRLGEAVSRERRWRRSARKAKCGDHKKNERETRNPAPKRGWTARQGDERGDYEDREEGEPQ